MPEQQRFDQLCQKVSSRLTAAGATPEDILATLPEVRNRVYAQRYEKSRIHKTAGRRRRSQRDKNS